VEVISQFFRTLPEAVAALWTFADGFYGLAVTVVSVVLTAALLFFAKAWRDTHSWLSATFGMMAGFVAFWWAFGILPSALIYYLDGNRGLLEGTVLPGALPLMDNAYQVTRDTLVVIETALAIVAFSMLAAAIQRRYPRTLAEGEERGPTTGGYK
jgi:chromate transport protein ChrA